ncbi:TonB-dependent receptor [Pelagicoccus sp. SDUM812003]|uniref:TonB-dependent receptor n=1 Tax=Pelagicoccus sp. SDUM812003 TaxID=3041267 RepID=UPI0028109276|nr:TonB-dependent receptor [Pelagicoccus sp. SDUM812003]MDQ8203172.1 TonB-dependent receptor [Pelagicoccus sp. SDUM812003]
MSNTLQRLKRPTLCVAGACLCGTASLFAQEVVELPALSVNANRLLPLQRDLSSPSLELSALDLDSGAYGDITEALESYPGYGAYRRTSSLVAHPSTQGIRLRNIGANATSRSLVLLDGVPQNDPFGAWIYWHEIDSQPLESVRLAPGANGGLWGNFGSSGLISFATKEPIAGAQRLQLGLSDLGRFELEGDTAIALSESLTLDIGGRYFETDGFHTLSEPQRGPVDRKADSQSEGLSARLRWEAGPDWRMHLKTSAFSENRGNGTAVARNSTDALNLSLLAERALDSKGSRLNLSAYLQDRSFENVYASVADDRASERPALDQFDVPASSAGASVVYRRQFDEQTDFSIGVDARQVSGDVNERFRNLGDGFTRLRRAGGEQRFLGLFLTHGLSLSENDRVAASLRFDRVSQKDGYRIEIDTENEVTLIDRHYDDREDDFISGDLAWRHQISDTHDIGLSLSSGFRAPTLNELYKPFRVKNDITEADPLLANERFNSIEADWNAALRNDQQLSVSVFHYEISEVIANALITTESGFDPRFGFIPQGGSGSVRANLDKSEVTGMELSYLAPLGQSLRAEARLMFSDSEILSDELSQFEGLAFPQAAPWRGNLALFWDPNEKLSLWGRYQWSDKAYEKLSPDSRLGETGSLNLGASYQFTESQRLSVSIENALDERNVAGISSDGLISLDAPRELRLYWSWRR